MSDQPIMREYTNGEVTVTWTPELCIHSGICLKGLPGVFNLTKRPWVNMEGAGSKAIVSLVRECPSRALGIKGVRFKEEDNSATEITLIPKGPLIVKGGATVLNRKNKEVHHKTVSFCRCGRSVKHPYCDGTHAKKTEEQTMPITIKDIANSLEISPSTVSRALNDHPNISDETKALVAAKAKEMKYQANFIAAGLRTRKSNSIGILVPHITSSFFSAAINGIQKVVSEHGYFTIICQSNENYHDEVDQIRSLLSCKVEGIILSISSETRVYEHLETLQAYDTPFVFFDRVAPGFDTPTVEANDFTGAYQAVEHLIKRGRKRIAHLGGPEELGISRRRYEGYLEALKTFDYEVNSQYSVFTDPDNSHEHIIEEMFSNPKKMPDALFTFSDELAVEAILKLKKMGFNVPRDVSVVGFGNSNLCEIVEPHLTSVTHEPAIMGEAAADLLFKVIQNRHIPPHQKNRKFDSRVIIRDSSR